MTIKQKYAIADNLMLLSTVFIWIGLGMSVYNSVTYNDDLSQEVKDKKTNNIKIGGVLLISGIVGIWGADKI